MQRLAYTVLSSLLILATTVPVKAATPTFSTIQANTVAQSNAATIDQMFREQRVLSSELQTMMAQMKTMMAEMKALTSLPQGQTPTMTDLYKQQQVILARLETLSQSRADTLLSGKNAATVQDIHQQQMAMMTDLKSMMAELKTLIEVYRGRADLYKR